MLLVGEVGTGKTSLLEAAASHAEARSWRVLGRDGVLSVNPGTSVHEFVEAVEWSSSSPSTMRLLSVPGRTRCSPTSEAGRRRGEGHVRASA